MARSTKKTKMQAIPALANAPRHISTSNQLGDLLVEDDLDNTGTLPSSNSEDDSSSSHNSSEDDHLLMIKSTSPF